MKNVIKSQIYNLFTKRNILYVYAFCVLTALITILNATANLEKHGIYDIAGSDILSTCGYYEFSLFFCAYVMCYAICKDLKNKSLYYEISCGISRDTALIGRYIAGLLISIVGITIVTYTPVILYTLTNEWGDRLSVGSMLFRAFEYYLFIARFAAEITIIAVIVGRTLPAFAVFMVINIIEERIVYYLYDINKLPEKLVGLFSPFSTQFILRVNTEYYYAVGTGLTPEHQKWIPVDEAVMMTLFSVSVICVALIAAKVIFRKKDFT